jgi:hypothetical protein
MIGTTLLNRYHLDAKLGQGGMTIRGMDWIVITWRASLSAAFLT